MPTRGTPRAEADGDVTLKRAHGEKNETTGFQNGATEPTESTEKTEGPWASPLAWFAARRLRTG